MERFLESILCGELFDFRFTVNNLLNSGSAISVFLKNFGNAAFLFFYHLIFLFFSQICMFYAVNCWNYVFHFSQDDGFVDTEELQTMRTYLSETQNEEFPQTKTLEGYTIQIYKNVFDPVLFRSGDIFGKMLPINKGCHFLEVGCGSGIACLVVADRGAAKIVALDISENALKNTMANMKRYKFEDITTTRISDVFSALSKEETFDMIFWNAPFYNVPKLDLTVLEKAVADCNYEKLRIYIANGHDYLNPDGRLMFGFSSTVGNIKILQDFAKSCGKKINLFDEITVNSPINSGKLKLELYEVTIL